MSLDKKYWCCHKLGTSYLIALLLNIDSSLHKHSKSERPWVLFYSKQWIFLTLITLVTLRATGGSQSFILIGLLSLSIDTLCKESKIQCGITSGWMGYIPAPLHPVHVQYNDTDNDIMMHIILTSCLCPWHTSPWLKFRKLMLSHQMFLLEWRRKGGKDTFLLCRRWEVWGCSHLC